MNNITVILFSVLLFTSCEKSINIEGYWMMDMENQPSTYFHPYDLKISSDTIEMADGYNFKQKASYQLIENEMMLKFSEESKFSYPFLLETDSIIYFAGFRYFRIPLDYYSKVESQKLIGYTASKMQDPEGNFTFAHLVKRHGSPIVILNDQTSELKQLPEFLIWSHGAKPKVFLYIGENVSLNDLIEVYCYIKPTLIKRIELVTGNKSFEEFYSIADYIGIDSLTYKEFQKRTNYNPPPPPPEPNSNLVVERSIEVFGMDDIVSLDTIKEFKNTEILVSNQLNIKEYFVLIEKLNDLGLNNKLKRFTTPNKTH